MNKKNMNPEEQSFFSMPQRVKAERMEKLFTRAVGDELVEKREEMVKHFDMGANRYQAVVYSEPVHYRESEEETWQEIDNTLEEAVNEQGRRVLRNRANRMHVEFPQEMDGGSMAEITDGCRKFAWRFEEEAQPIRAKIRSGAELKHERLMKKAQKLPKYVGRTLESLQAADLETEMETEQERRGEIAKLKSENTYENILPGVSVRYTLGSERVKEDIILSDAAALKHAKLRLPKDFDYEVSPSRQLLIKDKATGEIVFTMDTPFVYDAAGKETVADIVLTDYGNYIRLEYIPDAAFMAEAQFPVTIDPTINSTHAVTNIQDTSIGEGQTAKPYTDPYLMIGKRNGTTRYVSLLKFNTLAVVPASDTVISAVLQMCPKNAPSSNYIGAYEVKQPWESANTNWASLNPDLESNISKDALECVSGSSNWISFDLTNLYRKWCTRDASGNSNNNGVAFRTPDNITGNNYSELYSSDAYTAYRPVMYVNYISHAGLEGWWQYEQMSAGRAGTVYADLFNGNMVLEHSDTVMTGNRNPVSVSHFYNSCLSSSNSYNCGYGWKTDAHQKVTARTHNDRKYLVWEDGDGTEHFFDWSGTQPYKDCEGMDLEMSFNSAQTKIFIYDKEHNGLRFNVVQSGLAYLEATTDACNNVTTYSFVSGYETAGRIDKITDPVGRVTQFRYTSNLLSEIQIPAASGTRSVYFTYDSSSRLTGVRYGELGGTSAHTTYSYDGTTKLLTKARNYDGVQINVGYEPLSLYGYTATDQARHITSLETVSTNSSGTVTNRGAKQVFEYGAMTTTVTAVEDTSSDAGKKLYYQFNDSGNVICVRDDLGFARFTKFDSNFENKESEVSKMRKAVVNRLRKSDFNSEWDAFETGGTVTKDSTNLCLNCSSAKMVKTGAGETIYRQLLEVEAGTPFTFSAYVKTSALNNGGAFLRIIDGYWGSGVVLATSEVLEGSTAAAVGNDLPTDGWERIRVTLDAQPEETPIFAELVCNATSGTAWFACPQLETGRIANAFNLVSNGDFRYTTTSGAQTLPLDWSQSANNILTVNTGVFNRSNDPTIPAMLEGNYVQVEGRPDKNEMGFVQYYDMIGKKGDIFVVGGWADGKSIPNANTRNKGFTLALSLKKASDGTWVIPEVYPFNDEWVGWQQNCRAASAGEDYTQIALYIMYTGNCNKAKFTNIFLHREAYGTSFGRDSEGNVLSVSNLANQKSDIRYDSEDNITAYTQPGRDSSVADNQHWFYYGDTTADRKKHLLWRSRTPMHMMDYYSYDDYGNATSSRRVNYKAYTDQVDESTYPFIRTETDYVNGNYTSKTRDARGNEVVQEVNANDGTLTSVTDPTGQEVEYVYDASKRVTEVRTVDTKGTADTSDDVLYKNTYTYENDRIKTVSHNTTSDTANDVTYTFDYDALGRKTTVKVGTQVLSTNEYDIGRNTLLTGVEYGNGGKVGYTYDEFDRLTAVRYDNDTADRLTYEYGANGQVAQVTHVVDETTTRTARTDYDLADRPCQTVLHETVNGEKTRLYKTLLKYDKLNNLNQFAEDIQTEIHTTGYTYDRDNRVTEIAFDGGAHKVGYTYDELGRVATRVAECGATAGKLTSTYGYVAGGYGTNSATPLVASIAQEGVALSYAYDNRGNITSETRNGLTTTYVYDTLGQLVRVNDPHEDATWVFNYDRGGNITSKVRYAYTTGTLGTAQETIPYAYGDSNWKDKLTAYNGRTFTYDAIGNPTNDGVWSYEWAVGRRLKSMSAEGCSLYFKYDHNGLRTQKVVQQDWYPVTYNYLLHGKLITHMTVDYTDWDEVAQKDVLHFFYDAQSRPTKVSFNGVIYTYIHNLQGDTIGLLDSAGNLVVEYKYDAWGKLLSTTGTLADTLGKRNPFRYRGYVYDEESGLYYVQKRFYNSDICRFVSCDITDNLEYSTDSLSDKNLYNYCDNGPINRYDSGGDFWHIAVGAVFGAVCSAAAQVVTNLATGQKAFDGVVKAAAVGAVSGALAASGAGLVAQIAGNAALSAADSVYSQAKEKGITNINPGEVAVETLIGAVSGAAGGKGFSKTVNLRTLNRRLTSKVLSGSKTIARKAVRYYVSQTKTIIKRGLLPAIRKATYVSVTLRIGRSVVGRAM